MNGFLTESDKIRYLRNVVIGKKWATKPLKNISTVQYNFDQLVMALNKSIQLEREIQKTSTSSKTYYGQFTTHPKDVRKYDYSHSNDSRNYVEYRSQKYDDT